MNQNSKLLIPEHIAKERQTEAISSRVDVYPNGGGGHLHVMIGDEYIGSITFNRSARADAHDILIAALQDAFLKLYDAKRAANG